MFPLSIDGCASTRYSMISFLFKKELSRHFLHQPVSEFFECYIILFQACDVA